MEKILVKMLELGMDIEFGPVFKKLKDTEPITIRFKWTVSQDYVKYNKSCDWICFETEELCIADFKAQSVEIIQIVNELLDNKNNKKIPTISFIKL